LVTGDNNTIKPAYLQAGFCCKFILGLSKNILARLTPYSTFIRSFIIVLVIFITGCENDPKVVSELTRNVDLTEEAYNVESWLSQQGKMKAKLTAPLMIRVPRYDSPYVEFPKKLHVDFYNDSTQLDSWLDSKYGKYFESQNKVYLKDSVVVITMDGDTLRTPDLWWDQTAKIFYTDKYAEYSSASKQVYGGKGLRATQDLRSVVFKYPTGTIKTSSSGFPE